MGSLTAVFQKTVKNEYPVLLTEPKKTAWAKPISKLYVVNISSSLLNFKIPLRTGFT
jgi:hypothetical protein